MTNLVGLRWMSGSVRENYAVPHRNKNSNLEFMIKVRSVCGLKRVSLADCVLHHTFIHPSHIFKQANNSLGVRISRVVLLVYSWWSCVFMVRPLLSDDGPDEQHDLYNKSVAQHNENVQYARAAERALAICTCTCLASLAAMVVERLLPSDAARLERATILLPLPMSMGLRPAVRVNETPAR